MDCTDYRRHEFWCDHPHRTRRWRAADGCQGSCCDACWWRADSPRTWPDLATIAAIDADGIPLDPAARSAADTLGHLLRLGRPGRG